MVILIVASLVLGCTPAEQARPEWHPPVTLLMSKQEVERLFPEPPVYRTIVRKQRQELGDIDYEIVAYELEGLPPWLQGHIVLTFHQGAVVRSSARPHFFLFPRHRHFEYEVEYRRYLLSQNRSA